MAKCSVTDHSCFVLSACLPDNPTILIQIKHTIQLALFPVPAQLSITSSMAQGESENKAIIQYSTKNSILKSVGGSNLASYPGLFTLSVERGNEPGYKKDHGYYTRPNLAQSILSNLYLANFSIIIS